MKFYLSIFLMVFCFESYSQFRSNTAVNWMVIDTSNSNLPSNYITDITINIEDVEDRKRYEVKMFECYPKTISPIQMDYASKDIMKLQVVMQYKYWISSPVQVNQSSLANQSQSLINPSTQGKDYSIPESYYNDFSNFQTKYNETGYDTLIDRVIRSA